MTVGTDGATAPRRRDARRNRQLLLEAAHEVFGEQGLDAPLDVIARRAGVGNATLYRHFPTRAALVDAVFRDQLTGTTTAAVASTVIRRLTPRTVWESMVPLESSGSEAITDFPDRDEVLRVSGIVLELLAQLGHVGIDGAREHDRAVIPHFA